MISVGICPTPVQRYGIQALSRQANSLISKLLSGISNPHIWPESVSVPLALLQRL